MLKSHLHEKKLESLLLTLRFQVPSYAIFAFFGIMQAAVFYGVDQQILPGFIRMLDTDKIIIVYSILVLFCYDGHKTARLLLSSAVAALFIFIPISQYNTLSLHELGYAHHDTIYGMLLLLLPILCSINYYYHRYGIQLNNIGNHVYLAFWGPIINLLTVLFYMLLTLATVFIGIFLTKITGIEILWRELTDITLIKIYMPLLFSALCWLVNTQPNVSENVIRGFAYVAHHLYWLVAAVGIIVILGQCFIVATHLAMPEFDYRPLFTFTFASVLLFQLANYPDENYAQSFPLGEKLTLYYNSLLPLIPGMYLIKFFTHFIETNADLACNATLLETGLSLGNFAPLLAGFSLLYLTLIQAYYSHQSKEIMQLRLTQDSWWLCLVYVIITLIAYNPLFSIKPDYEHYLEHCHHFKEHGIDTFANTHVGRYVA